MPRPRTGRRIALIVAGVVLFAAAFGVAAYVFLSDLPFESADELAPENVQSLRVFVVNRRELDGGPDVGPYFAAEGDFAGLLAPLKAVPEVPGYPDAQGPWLGEYRVRTKAGRKGNIKFYWHRVGTGPATLRFKIGPHFFEGGTAAAVIRAAEDAAPRGVR